MKQQTPWIIIHIPHASRHIPASVRDQFVVTDQVLQQQLDILTDHYTYELFAVKHPAVVVHQFPVSRFVVDPERFVDDSEEPMAKKGQGVVYMTTTDQKPLRRILSQKERFDLLEQYYWPHHQQLEMLVANALDVHNKALIIDGHSFPNKPLPVDMNQQPDRPDICIGTDAFHTPQQFFDECRHLFAEARFSVAINQPYAGTMVPLRYYRQDNRVWSIMIEVNRRTYLKHEPFDLLRTERFSHIQQLINELVCLLE